MVKEIGNNEIKTKLLVVINDVRAKRDGASNNMEKRNYRKLGNDLEKIYYGLDRIGGK